MASILLLGGSGFIGQRVAHQLTRMGEEVRVTTRDRERAKERLILLPTVDVRTANVHDDADLDAMLQGVDGVINLIGVLHDRPRGAFQRSHVDLPRRLIESCRRNGVTRVLHMSALQASPAAPSHYLRSKAEGERTVAQAQDLATTIFRPSVVFGPGDHFLCLFAKLAGLAPVLPLACANAKFQPLFVEDLARAIALSVTHRATYGRSYDLGGPKVYTLRHLVEYAALQAGIHPVIWPLPNVLARIQASIMQHLPGRLLTPDNLDSMKVDSVTTTPFPDVFGFSPTPLEAVAPGYLGQATSRARYDQFRARR